jgi:mannose-6-phosphate isomerase-like protein (cupin superfamily)
MTRQIREFLTFWDDPNARIFVQRDREELIGSESSGGRNLPKFRPFDLLKGITYSDNGLHSIPVYYGHDMTVFVECPAGAYPFFHREVDQDIAYLQYRGKSTVETEHGVFEIESGEMLLIPRGISQRTIGSPDCLRWALYYREPVQPGVDVDNPTCEYHFDVKREPDITYEAPPPDRKRGVRRDGKIREVIRVRDHSEDDTWVWRTYETLVGCRLEGGRQVLKFGYFNYFKGKTGTGKGSGAPELLISPTIKAEGFNTVGEQFGFHRGCDNEEMWIQFSGSAMNEAEFGEYELGTSEMAQIPMGISHRVVALPGYVRCTLYAKNYMRQLVTDKDHVTDTKFTVTPHLQPLQQVEDQAPQRQAR